MSLPLCKKCNGQIIYSQDVGAYLCGKCNYISDHITIDPKYFEK